MHYEVKTRKSLADRIDAPVENNPNISDVEVGLTQLKALVWKPNNNPCVETLQKCNYNRDFRTSSNYASEFDLRIIIKMLKVGERCRFQSCYGTATQLR